jgi:ribose transport system permease protein
MMDASDAGEPTPPPEAAPPPEATPPPEAASAAGAPAAGGPAGPWHAKLTRAVEVRNVGILLPFVALFISLSIASSPFATKTNLLQILDQQAATLIIAAAGTLVLVAGGIDLSVGATYSLAGVTAARMAEHTSPAVAILIGIAAGVLVGAVNGLVVTVLRINSLIVTLATAFIAGGVATRITNGNLLVLFDHPSFGDLAKTEALGVKTSIWIMLAAVIVIGFVLGRATVGRYIYAVGGNDQAALLAGVPVNAVRVLTFVLSGAAAGLAGVLDTARVLSAQASTGDINLTFSVLTGIVVGGTSILGGIGAVWRTVVGVLFIALIYNGYELLHFNVVYEPIILGVILIAAVALDSWSRRRQ